MNSSALKPSAESRNLVVPRPDIRNKPTSRIRWIKSPIEDRLQAAKHVCRGQPRLFAAGPYVRDDRRVTIVFRLPPAAAERVAFSYSPAMEAVLSLHVLVEPKHHPVQHEWVRAMRRLPRR